MRGRRMGTPAAILGAKLVRSEVEHGKHHDQDAHAIAQRSRLFSSHHISSRSLGLVAWMPSYTPTTYPPDFHGVELAALGYARGTRRRGSVRCSMQSRGKNKVRPYIARHFEIYLLLGMSGTL